MVLAAVHPEKSALLCQSARAITNGLLPPKVANVLCGNKKDVSCHPEHMNNRLWAATAH